MQSWPGGQSRAQPWPAGRRPAAPGPWAELREAPVPALCHAGFPDQSLRVFGKNISARGPATRCCVTSGEPPTPQLGVLPTSQGDQEPGENGQPASHCACLVRARPGGCSCHRAGKPGRRGGRPDAVTVGQWAGPGCGSVSLSRKARGALCRAEGPHVGRSLSGRFPGCLRLGFQKCLLPRLII